MMQYGGDDWILSSDRVQCTLKAEETTPDVAQEPYLSDSGWVSNRNQFGDEYILKRDNIPKFTVEGK